MTKRNRIEDEIRLISRSQLQAKEDIDTTGSTDETRAEEVVRSDRLNSLEKELANLPSESENDGSVKKRRDAAGSPKGGSKRK